VIALLVAIFGMDRVDNEPPMFPLMALLWLYRVMVVVTLVGLVREVIRAFRRTTFTSMQQD
jgi:cytochrome c-type biogenesis protein CcmH/NrfF